MALKAQLHQRFGAAVAETDHHDLWQRSTLTASVVGRSPADVGSRTGLNAGSMGNFRRGYVWKGPCCLPTKLFIRMPGDRMRRVNEAVKEVLSTHIAGDLRDPRVGFVTVTSVETSPDLRSARVYVSVLGGEDERAQSLAGLDASHGYLQSQVAAELRMKRTPVLEFVYDDSIDTGMRISGLLEEEGK